MLQQREAVRALLALQPVQEPLRGEVDASRAHCQPSVRQAGVRWPAQNQLP